MKSTPHFVLFSRTGEQTFQTNRQGGCWYFRLESARGKTVLEATDSEPTATRERLELLAVVRGLEALNQPSSVTLVTSSRQVSRAVRQGLEYWRIRDWKWERFGEKVPMKNGDLWQRIDRALQIHAVRCRTHPQTFRIDSAHDRLRPAYPTRPAARQPMIEQQTPDLASAMHATDFDSEFESTETDQHELVSRRQLSNSGHGDKKTERASFVLFRPFVWGTQQTAKALHSTADALQRCLESTSPHLT